MKTKPTVTAGHVTSYKAQTCLPLHHTSLYEAEPLPFQCDRHLWTTPYMTCWRLT